MSKTSKTAAKNNKKVHYVLLCSGIIVAAFLTFAITSGRRITQDASIISSSAHTIKSFDVDTYTSIFTPTWYFEVAGTEYTCTFPSIKDFPIVIDNTTIYYNSNDPNDCSVERPITIRLAFTFGFLLLVFIIVGVTKVITKVAKRSKSQKK